MKRSRSRFTAQRPGALLLLMVASGCANGAGEPQERVAQGREPLIFGADNRTPYTEITDGRVRRWADATAVVVANSQIEGEIGGPGMCSLKKHAYERAYAYNGSGGDDYPLCSGAAFAGYPQLDFAGSAFLVGPELFLTAGHNLPYPWSCGGDRLLVFGFVDGSASDEEYPVPCAGIYRCTGVRTYGWDSTGDWALLMVDRPVRGVTPLIINYSGTVAADAQLMVIGHPWGLTEMVAGNGMVRSTPSSESAYFATSVDAFTGNSGGPVINVATGVVEGIHSGNSFPDLITPHFVTQVENGVTCAIERHCSESTGCEIPGGGIGWATETATTRPASQSYYPFLHAALVMTVIH